jgi:hypothetical protein
MSKRIKCHHAIAIRLQSKLVKFPKITKMLQSQKSNLNCTLMGLNWVITTQTQTRKGKKIHNKMRDLSIWKSSRLRGKRRLGFMTSNQSKNWKRKAIICSLTLLKRMGKHSSIWCDKTIITSLVKVVKESKKRPQRGIIQLYLKYLEVY